MSLLSTAHESMVTLLAEREPAYNRTATAWHRVASPVLLDADRLAAELAEIRRLCVLVDLLPELAFGGDRQAFWRSHGLPTELDDLLADDGLGDAFFARPDCVLAGGRLRVLELNVGTGTVNMAATAASELYFATATPYPEACEALASWRLTGLTPIERLARTLGEFAGGGRVGLWYHDRSAAAGRRVADVCTVLSAYGVDAVPVHTDEVADFDAPLYGYFSVIHLLGTEGPALREAVRGAMRRRPLVRPGDLPRNLKANLALLYELAAQGRLSPTDARIVLDHVPATVLLATADPATLEGIRRDKDGWVVKPSGSFKGDGVYVGRSLSQRRWEAALTDAGSAIAQRFVAPDPLPMLVHDGDGLRTVTGGRLVLMPHLLAGRFAGMSARFSTDRDVLGVVDFDTVFPTMCASARAVATMRQPAPVVAGGTESDERFR